MIFPEEYEELVAELEKEISGLKAENARLRGALRSIEREDQHRNFRDPLSTTPGPYAKIARAALKETDHGRV